MKEGGVIFILLFVREVRESEEAKGDFRRTVVLCCACGALAYKKKC